MALEDFERELAEDKARESRDSRERDHKRKRSRSRDRDRHHRHRHHHRHRDDDHKRSHHDRKRSRKHHRSEDEDDDEIVASGAAPPPEQILDQRLAEADGSAEVKRDSWMKAPQPVEYVQRKRPASPKPKHVAATEKDFKLRVHQNELNKHLQDIDRPDEVGRSKGTNTQREVDYEFGDDGSSWRMTKLKGVYQEAKNSGRAIDTVALERYGTLQAFDEAREEEIEMGRREMRGSEYVGKMRPSGDLYAERKLDADVHDLHNDESEDEFEAALGQGRPMKEKSPPATTVSLDQTALNRLKAQMMRAKLRNAPEAADLEAQYNAAAAGGVAAAKSSVVVLNKMEARQLAGGREGEVNRINNKRGRERGTVEENEDMSIEDMVRQERRSKNQFGGSGRAFAERIAKDVKFDNDLDYMDENAARLAKSVQKSEINLRNTAIEDYHKTKRILETCPLCHHEDTGRPPQAPIVSLGTRTYLTLPTAPEITPYNLCATIVPIQHRANLLECDDDEWEELRNFMKTLSRFYYSLKPKRSVIFYENAAHEGRRRHASLEAVPLPMSAGETAPAFFREAILAADAEWTQHRPLIDTARNAVEHGMGKLAFRRSMVTELPYFHVWFSLDGGLGHVVEDPKRWPKGDLFAREVIGGMLDVAPDVVKRQGRWRKGDAEMEGRVRAFFKGWKEFDWTQALVEAEAAS